MGGVSKRKSKGNNRAARHERATRRWPDQIRADLDDGERARVLREEQPVDFDKPALGQFYCVECDRHFESGATLDRHSATKKHRRRVKELLDSPPYTQKEAEAAAGMGAVDTGIRGADME
ncbi:Zinc finger protein bud20 [Porphyridium purpureum]|uniref:Zinc finger protein bud20 n=1 Tax=Porphyridium purpureum TaxID=35688 RepID=A0A5J4Z197_PORPP|nr:Zinc finger protein bud20 [Porphyridium purpureum]|eukprot:POR7890..scf208_2